jgi:hypothetical protein
VAEIDDGTTLASAIDGTTRADRSCTTRRAAASVATLKVRVRAHVRVDERGKA